jgi:hypothetical protein
MPDLDFLRDLPELRPVPGQVEAALVQVRVRRRRTALMTLTSATASVAALVLMLSHSSGVQSLQPVSPDVARTATAAPAQEGPGGEATTGLGPRLATASPVATPSVSASPTPDAGESPEAAGPRDKPPVVRIDYSNLTNPNRKVDNKDNNEACGPGVTIPTGYGWCHGALPVDRGAAGISLQENICASIGGTVTQKLRFASTHEAEIVVYDDSDTHELWRSSVGVTYERSPHVLSYSGGDCSEWSVLWDRTDESGHRLAPGWYWFHVTVLADNVIENASRVHVL